MMMLSMEQAQIERVHDGQGALLAPPAPARMDLCLRLADLAVSALIDEVTLTPKPGLVDLRSRGAHRDLSWDLMCHSAWALHPTFLAMARAGHEHAQKHGSSAVSLRETIGAIGRSGEAAMMQASAGVNTHRGAIWALGLLVTAAAQGQGQGSSQAWHAPAAVAARAGVLARITDRYAPISTGNNGERVRREHGVGGAVAQARAGFPHVIEIALPALLAARLRGDGESAARLNALLAIIARLDDTCVLSRGGPQALAAVQAGAAAVLAAGGAGSGCGQLALQSYEYDLLARHVSPGGAADLLAATLLLDSIASERLH
jgi:triphosphoribosyl-dephospho-CoA synthase